VKIFQLSKNEVQNVFHSTCETLQKYSKTFQNHCTKNKYVNRITYISTNFQFGPFTLGDRGSSFSTESDYRLHDQGSIPSRGKR
jgi:hypothetical protein